MTKTLIKLIRRFNRAGLARNGCIVRVCILTVLLLGLTACQFRPADLATGLSSLSATATPAFTSSSETSLSTSTEPTDAATTPWESQPETSISSETETSPQVSPTPDGTSSDTSSLTPVPTSRPTATPTGGQSATPTRWPTATPTGGQSATPTRWPTATPTGWQTATPTLRPTATPTRRPTATPTLRPTATPTLRPTATPTLRPTSTPTPTTAAGGFPYRNYGTFFRDNYGTNSDITASADGGILMDTGCSPYGVALVKVISIPADKRCKVIASANGKSYQYDIIPRNKYMGIPLQLGNGSYTIKVYEQVSGTSYTTKMTHTFSVTLASSLKPYTAASVMSDFSKGSACVLKASSLCSGIATTNGKVDAVYRWIVNNINYDSALAASITSGAVTTYIPNPNTTYSTKKGICFDYASLMCAMLRSQGIPTRLVVGQTPLGYHAWNEVYFAGTGWVVVASFSWKLIDGSGWVMFDTTFAAGGMSPESIQSTTHTKVKTY